VNVPPVSTPSPAVRASLERLRELLVEEGGLIASIVGSAGDRDAALGAARRPAAAGERPPPGSESQIARPESDRAVDGRAATTSGAGPAQLVASGPRAEGSREDYELLIETIYEGYLLHYGTPRVARTADDDLGLLAGDRLYALGLARLVALGDIVAVVELADTITLSALAQGAREPELADAVWAAGALAIGWGSSKAHRRAKKLVLAGSSKAIEAMRTSAAGLAAPR
jgi:hypothetical protein